MFLIISNVVSLRSYVRFRACGTLFKVCEYVTLRDANDTYYICPGVRPAARK